MAEPVSGSGPVRSPSRIQIVLAGLFVLLVVVVCVRLGFWQLDRLEQRRAQNAALERAAAEPVLVLDAHAAAEIARDPEAYLFRRVRVRGAFQPAADVVLRGRSHMGQPGVHLFAPLRIDDAGPVVLVNRGWVGAPDAATVDPRPYREHAAVEVEGVVQPFPAARGEGVPVEREVDGYRVFSLARLDSQALQARVAEPLAPFYIQQLPWAGADGYPVRLQMPPVEDGPHLAYAVQWFSFAAIFLVGFVIIATRRTRPHD
jgi:surfeit locus 1 family protein